MKLDNSSVLLNLLQLFCSSRLLKDLASLSDAYLIKQPDNLPFTFNDPKNSFTKKKKKGSRIDYILFKDRKDISYGVSNYEHPLPNRIPGKKFSFSPHEAIRVSFKTGISDREPSAFKDADMRVIIKCIIKVKSLRHNYNLAQVFYYFFAVVCVLTLLALMLLEPLYNYIGGILTIIFAFFGWYSLFMASVWIPCQRHAMKECVTSLMTYLEDPRRSSMGCVKQNVYLRGWFGI